MTDGLYPLRLTAPAEPHAFGGRVTADRLGRAGLPDGGIAEGWECSDVDGDAGEVLDVPLAGTPLRRLVADRPEELVGAGWSGERLPVLTEFIDASGTLPVHLHADDAAVLRRLPVRAGETVYVPGSTPHSFGPRTLVDEVEQTSDVQQHAMRWRMEDGSPVDDEEFAANIDAFVDEVRLEPRPEPVPGLTVRVGDGVGRVVLTADPHFALGRWRAGTAEPLRRSSATAQVLSNAGAPVRVTCGDWSEELGRTQTLLLPAALGSVEVTGPADVLFGYLPGLERDVRAPLAAAGYGPGPIAALGEGLEAA